MAFLQMRFPYRVRTRLRKVGLPRITGLTADTFRHD